VVPQKSRLICFKSHSQPKRLTILCLMMALNCLSDTWLRQTIVARCASELRFLRTYGLYTTLLSLVSLHSPLSSFTLYATLHNSLHYTSLYFTFHNTLLHLITSIYVMLILCM